ncbi:BON domain-containing protein [Piscinibacter sp. XHJ-5]|uniref:BON domain-containing protein n=1 Tax=Piscinibacter sp. XHJ-5 TaxID=3037797 RepID=UPI002452CEA4|nr:BON domain-containing protein [Piscinibacter sp. XHJ-5]
MRAAVFTLLLAACASAPPAPEPRAADVLSLNPFNDPFVQATRDRPCPAPRGPAYTEAQRLQEAHYRVERGTSCWLAGQCSEPNAYRYDARIAEAAVAALRGDAAVSAGTSIWVIAERRFVYLQGCIADAAQAARAEAIVKALPDVQLVIPSLSLPGEGPRYPVP